MKLVPGQIDFQCTVYTLINAILYTSAFIWVCDTSNNRFVFSISGHLIMQRDYANPSWHKSFTTRFKVVKTTRGNGSWLLLK